MARVLAAGRLQVVDSQNLALWSEDLSQAAWNKNTGVSVVANTPDVSDPTGGNAASKLTYNGTGGAGAFRLFQSCFTTTKGQSVSAALWVRVLAGTKSLQLTNNASLMFVPFVASATWQRVSVDGTSTATGNALLVALYDGVGLNAAFSVYLWGGQASLNGGCGYRKTTNASFNPRPAQSRGYAFGRVAVAGRVPA